MPSILSSTSEYSVRRRSRFSSLVSQYPLPLASKEGGHHLPEGVRASEKWRPPSPHLVEDAPLRHGNSLGSGGGAGAGPGPSRGVTREVPIGPTPAPPTRVLGLPLRFGVTLFSPGLLTCPGESWTSRLGGWGAECTASGVPWETCGPWALEFPQKLAPLDQLLLLHTSTAGRRTSTSSPATPRAPAVEAVGESLHEVERKRRQQKK